MDIDVFCVAMKKTLMDLTFLLLLLSTDPPQGGNGGMVRQIGNQRGGDVMALNYHITKRGCRMF